MDVESLLKQSVALQTEIKAIAQEIAVLQQDLEEEVTEFCNIEKTTERDPREITMDMSSILNSRRDNGEKD